jgi:hypothetical protein
VCGNIGLNTAKCHGIIDEDADLIIEMVNFFRSRAHAEVEQQAFETSRSLESVSKIITSKTNDIQRRGGPPNRISELSELLTSVDKICSSNPFCQSEAGQDSVARSIIVKTAPGASLDKFRENVLASHLYLKHLDENCDIAQVTKSLQPDFLSTEFQGLVGLPAVVAPPKRPPIPRFLGEGVVHNPAGLALFDDPNDGTLVYVADSGNHKVRLISASTGETFRNIGFGEGVKRGQLKNPMGIVFYISKDNMPLLYVADMNNNRVLIFNAITGAILQFIGSGKGSRHGEMAVNR